MLFCGIAHLSGARSRVHTSCAVRNAVIASLM